MRGPSTFEVIERPSNESHGTYDTIDEARGCVAYDRLTDFEIWQGDHIAEEGGPGADNSPFLDSLIVLPLGKRSADEDRCWAVQNGRGEVIVEEPRFSGPHRLYCHGCRSNTCGHVAVVTRRVELEG